MKRKITSLLLSLILIFSLFSCDDYYEPVESSELEATTVMTIRVDNESYEVPYELYRAFFLQLKGTVDGGKSEVWQSEDSAEYVEKIDKMILSRIADVYALYHLAKTLGIDLYSDENEETLDEYIKASVDGGVVDGAPLNGFGGDYDAYLSSLAEMNLNYSAQRALLRYSLASELIDFYYLGDDTTDGALEYSREDVYEFYLGDESARYIKGYFSTSNEAFSMSKLNLLHSEVSALGSESEVAIKIINASLTVGEEVMRGDLLGTHSLDPMYYAPLTDGVFSLRVGECAPLIKISTGIDEGYYLVYRADKTEEFFTENYSYVCEVYERHMIGKAIAALKEKILSSDIKITLPDGITHANISMK